MVTRQPIVSIVGHVDHGKTTLLDRVRGSAVAKGEAGAITQHIGCSVIPLASVKKICGSLLEKLKLKFTIPGLLFIDTPGHAAFTNLRKRGGALADIAVLVVDVNEGFKPQTLESIEILKADKTPFIVAANKIDLVTGWNSDNSKTIVENIARQAQRTQEIFETKIYELVGKLYELGFQADRFDRVSDYTKQLAIIPVSGLTGEGVAELLMVISGLAQKFLQEKLEVEVKGFAKGTVLEVKEEKGLGITVDVIVYDGKLKVGDVIVIGGLEKPVVTKVRALLEPLPLVEMGEKKAKFKNVNEVFAAAGVKVSAPELDKVVAGMPLKSCSAGDVEKVTKEIQKEVKAILIETDEEGVIVKADTLGSLEAMNVLLREKQIPIRTASIGKITKKELVEAENMGKINPFYAVVLGFNVEVIEEAEKYLAEKDVKVIMHDVIYKIIEDYEKWKEAKKRATEMAELDNLVRGGKFRVLGEGYIFRQSNPAVFGVEVMMGRVKANEAVVNANGKKLGAIKSIQEEQKSIPVLEVGKRAAIAMDDVTFGRQVKSGEILYTDIPEEHFRKMKELKHYLDKEDVELLKEVAEIKRKKNMAWGV